MTDEFYLQDSRTYVGNDMLFWKPGGKGYTTDLSQAAVFTREEAQRHHDARGSDVPWPKAYIDAHTRPACDRQYVSRDEALAAAGIVLNAKAKAMKRGRFRCAGCGRTMSELQFWDGDCAHCGTDSRP